VDPIYTNVPPVRSNSPASHMGSVKGVSYASGNPGPRIEILVQFHQVDMRGSNLSMKVDIRVSGFPNRRSLELKRLSRRPPPH
jgi:hypothetical protein